MAFQESCSDIERLISLHRKEGGKGPGRRRGLEVLNKSAIVPITAFWEAYCEDVVSEALRILVEQAMDHKKLPLDLQKRIARELREDKHDLAIWKVSGEGWREVILERFDALKVQRDRKLNTPKTSQINDLFQHGIGLKEISRSWNIAPGKDSL